MKLAQGEYVALEKIENAYGSCTLLAQIYVHGDPLQDHLVGIVVPDPAALALLVNRTLSQRVDAEDAAGLDVLVKDERVVQAIMDEMTREGKKAGLHGFEMVKKIHVTLEAFTSENGLLTPTLKIRRRDAQAKYKDVISKLYATPNSTPSSSKL